MSLIIEYFASFSTKFTGIVLFVPLWYVGRDSLLKSNGGPWPVGRQLSLG